MVGGITYGYCLADDFDPKNPEWASFKSEWRADFSEYSLCYIAEDAAQEYHRDGGHDGWYDSGDARTFVIADEAGSVLGHVEVTLEYSPSFGGEHVCPACGGSKRHPNCPTCRETYCRCGDNWPNHDMLERREMNRCQSDFHPKEA